MAKWRPMGQPAAEAFRRPGEILRSFLPPLEGLMLKQVKRLEDQADALPRRSVRERARIAKRITLLESYCPIVGEIRDQHMKSVARIILEPHGYTLNQKRRGRPVEFRSVVLHALEAKLANPEATWAEVAREYPVPNLARHVSFLTTLLDREGIALPLATDYILMVPGRATCR